MSVSGAFRSTAGTSPNNVYAKHLSFECFTACLYTIMLHKKILTFPFFLLDQNNSTDLEALLHSKCYSKFSTLEACSSISRRGCVDPCKTSIPMVMAICELVPNFEIFLYLSDLHLSFVVFYSLPH